MTLDAHLQRRRGSLSLDVPLTAAAGSVTAVLGPNGAGKTTILDLLAGHLALDHGHLRLDGRLLDDPATGTFVPPEQRRIGRLHQDLLLFPHLTALDNVAFAARARGASRAAARQVARSWLERVGVAAQARARPGALSGGQAQRVALARALAADPLLLLLDEPLSALDAGTRGTTRRDLRRHLDGFAGTTIVVTHDPIDALTLADQVVVVERGIPTQAGSLVEVTARPRTRYVADLLGTNLLAGTAQGLILTLESGARATLADPAAGPTFAVVPPRAVAVHRAEPEGSPRNRWPATVIDVELLGERVRVSTDGPVALVAEITPAAAAELGLHPGAPVWVSVKATEILTYPR